MVKTPDEIYRDYVTDGVPASGNWQPPKLDIREFLNSKREALTADREYFVSITGDDNNNGRSALTAFRTKQKAANVVQDLLDLKGFTVVVKVADSSFYTDECIVDKPINGTLIFRGNISNWSAVVTTVGASVSAFDVRNNAVVHIEGFKFVSSGASHIATSQGGVVFYKNCDFGNAGAGNHVIAYNEGNAFINGDYKVTGSAAVHLHATEKALIRTLLPVTVTIENALTFSNFFVGVSNATGYLRGMTFTLSGGATVTGQRFYVHKNGLIDTNNQGLTYFPGSVAGTAINGGIYDLMELARNLNFAQPGLVIFDSGLWLQWGFTAFNNGNTVAFFATFPTNCFGVVATAAVAPPGTGLYVPHVSSLGNSSFLAHGRQYSGGSVSTVSLSTSWLAWGN